MKRKYLSYSDAQKNNLESNIFKLSYMTYIITSNNQSINKHLAYEMICIASEIKTIIENIKLNHCS